MNKTQSPAVLVGIDGSDTAIGAALWAVDEAVSRSVPLRLLYVIRTKDVITTSDLPSADAYAREVEHAKTALRTAQAAVQASGEPVKVETAILEGPPGTALIGESDGAEMICVGTVGIGQYARSILGSTAAELAENALCPVAVVRQSQLGPSSRVGWIVVGAATAQPDQDAVVEFAMQEAQIRHCPVLLLGTKQTSVDASEEALDREVQTWQQRYPDVRVYPIADRADVARFVKTHDEPVALAVVGPSDANNLAEIIGRHGHLGHHHAVSSALIVRR